MAFQSIPLMTFSKRVPPYGSQHAKMPVSRSRMTMSAPITAEGVHQLYFNQLNHIRNHLDEIRSPPSPTARNLTRRTLAGTAD
jgi:hypothetical protein